MKKQQSRKYLWLIFTIIFAILLTSGFFKVASWFDTHTIHKQRILSMTWHLPIEILPREAQVREIIIKPATPDQVDTPIKRYICDTFGQYQCLIAVAVASVEGLNHPPDSFNINSNGTIDVGYFRINSVHFDRDGCRLVDVIDPYKNIDCAKILFDEQGWGIWVGYSNGNYLAKLED